MSWQKLGMNGQPPHSKPQEGRYATVFRQGVDVIDKYSLFFNSILSINTECTAVAGETETRKGPALV